MKADGIKGHLDLLLLAAVAKGRAHGYAVIEALRRRSGGRFDFPEGTIYPALHRLEDDGLLSSRWANAEGRRRRVYELTAKGRVALAREREAWAEYTGAVSAVLEGAS
jgi:DNA-binding PadR family transcriptional regulator